MAVKQKDSKLSLTIKEIKSVKAAIQILNSILQGIESKN